MKIKVGQKVLIATLVLQYSDYKNIDGVISEIDEDFVRVAIPKNKLFVEDEKELQKEGDTVIVRVKKEAIA